jgi:GMP synthase (glutamine-hydrolysing)
MAKLLVCQHVPFEILGTLNPLFKSSGFRIRYVNFGRQPDAKPSLDGYHGLVILGGPMNAHQVRRYPHLTTEIHLIQEAVERGMPVLGICLGAQLIARALGAEVTGNQTKEIGWYEVSPTGEGKHDPLLRHFGESETIFQWHGDTFGVPREALRLASSPACSNQAFRFRTNVYGLQFHLEVDERMIERWLNIPMHKKEIESLKGEIDSQVIRRETRIYMKRLKQLSESTFGEFIKLFGVQKKRHRLASR